MADLKIKESQLPRRKTPSILKLQKANRTDTCLFFPNKVSIIEYFKFRDCFMFRESNLYLGKYVIFWLSYLTICYAGSDKVTYLYIFYSVIQVKGAPAFCPCFREPHTPQTHKM